MRKIFIDENFTLESYSLDENFTLENYSFDENITISITIWLVRIPKGLCIYSCYSIHGVYKYTVYMIAYWIQEIVFSSE